MAGELRASDVAARFGGDEFAVLLPNTSAGEAQRLAERIRKAVSHAPIQVRNGLAVDFTLSIGIACLVPPRDANDFAKSRQMLLELADAALYRAKSAGRNRVESDP